MKISLIANVSANGKVVLTEDLTKAPQDAVGIYVQKVMETGNLVIGRKTYKIMQQSLGSLKQIFPGVEVVLLSADKIAEDVQVANDPEEAIRYLIEKGFTEIVVGGGTETYNAFLDKELVTDIYFNYIPVIIGLGGVLGTADELNTIFKLAGTQTYDGGIVQLHLSK